MPTDAKSPDAITAMLARAESQATLFALRPSRLALQKLAPDQAPRQKLRVNVWRNHAIESVLALAAPYFAYAGWDASFHLSNYDDSLSFADHHEADAELLWLDPSRYAQGLQAADTLAWLAQRVQALRLLSKAPIVIASWPADTGLQDAVALQALADQLPDVLWADLAEVSEQYAVPLIDARTKIVAGTPLANAAQAVIARKLVCHWLAGALLPPVKAIALDLDQTLHEGVLGEDGNTGVILTPAMAALQQMLKAQRDRGVFLALVSRNEAGDVQELFAQRGDYPLRWSDFSATEVSWGHKADALARVANTLRIAPDALLFVDDNPGELAGVAAALPGLKLVHAGVDPDVTQRGIAYQPGLWRWRQSDADAKRIADLQANTERSVLAARAVDSADYFRSLALTLTLTYDAVPQRSRAAELCRKTNQFNLALRRFSEAEIAERMQSPRSCVATIQLADRLSDSGVIGVLIAEKHGSSLRVEELCISCRAMGRQMEDTVVLSALAGMPLLDGCDAIVFLVQHGPRNQPAQQWLARLLGQAEPLPPGEHRLAIEQIRNFRADPHLTVRRPADSIL